MNSFASHIWGGIGIGWCLGVPLGMVMIFMIGDHPMEVWTTTAAMCSSMGGMFGFFRSLD